MEPQIVSFERQFLKNCSCVKPIWFLNSIKVVHQACPGTCDYSHVCHEGVNSPGNIKAIVGVLITNLTPLAPVSITKNKGSNRSQFPCVKRDKTIVG